MRRSISAFSWGLLSALVFVGCTIKSSSDEPDGGGAAGSGTAGSGGEAGQAGEAGSAGAAGASNGACGEVPVNGVCADDKTIKSCVIPETADPENNPEYVLTTSCTGDRACRVQNGLAQCVLIGQCSEGDVACTADGNSLRVCHGSGESAAWTDTPCDTAGGEKCIVPKPGDPAKCTVVPSSSGGSGPTLVGRITYQYRTAKEDYTGWTDLKTADAIDVYVGIFDGDELIGKALTGYNPDTQQFTNDGTFLAHLTKETSSNTTIWVWPMAFNYDTGQPMMALAKPTSSDPLDSARNSNTYWSFSTQLSGPTADMGTWEIKENEGSGALRIYSWVDYGLLRTSQGLPGKPQKSVIIYWDPTMETPTCGACFCGPNCGGGQVKYGSTDSEVDYYDSWIALGGPSNDGSTQWASSVVSHEFGHYVMMNYSLSPGEGGTHYVGQASKPGLAYSEGWATSFGQTNVSSPLYVDEQGGTMFWVNLSNYKYNNKQLQKPDPNGGIDQYVNENIVAGMMWKLWVDTSQDSDGRGLGDAKMFGAITHPALVSGDMNRGYSKVDFVDFLDAALCSNNATDADVTSVLETTGFPYNPAEKVCR